MSSGRIIGAEALLRWFHPEEGFISPQGFIPVAEESGLIMEIGEASARLLDELRHLGISIAIDDFGTGYSSLAYLTRFPVNKLKIDRSFIRNVCIDEQNAEISRAIVSLGHTLNMKVVAEGIELEQQLEFLKSEGCDEGQGYLIAKPLPHDEFVSFLKHHSNGFSDIQQPDTSIQCQPLLLEDSLI